MIDEINEMLDTYAAWLRDKTTLRRINDEWCEIATPYVDRHNDYVHIYARKEDGQYVLTDAGETIEDLQMSGCSLDSPKRQGLLAVTANGFGVKVTGKNALEVRTSREGFPLRKHNLVQAILAVDDLFYMASPIVSSLFLEDVAAWMDLHDIRNTPRIKFTGQSGFDHMFDFVIPRSRQRPERILRAMNRPDKSAAQGMVFAWHDTRAVRDPESRAYAILNDSERTVREEVLFALKTYEITPVPWSERESYRPDLAA